jgi:hypothetical protein
MLEEGINTVVAFFLGALVPIFSWAYGYINGYGEGYIIGYHSKDLNEREFIYSLNFFQRRKLRYQYPELIRFKWYCRIAGFSILTAVCVPAFEWLLYLNTRAYLIVVVFGLCVGMYAASRMQRASLLVSASTSLIEMARRK